MVTTLKYVQLPTVEAAAKDPLSGKASYHLASLTTPN